MLVASCGYHFGAVGPQGVRALEVRAEDEQGIDVDAGALLASAVRRAVAHGPSTHLAPPGEAEAILEVRLIEARAPLSPLSDTAVRAGEYRAEVVAVGTLVAPDGRVLWRSQRVIGSAPFLSAPGALETQEGLRRAALARAAEEAAERLVTALRSAP